MSFRTYICFYMLSVSMISGAANMCAAQGIDQALLVARSGNVFEIRPGSGRETEWTACHGKQLVGLSPSRQGVVATTSDGEICLVSNHSVKGLACGKGFLGAIRCGRGDEILSGRSKQGVDTDDGLWEIDARTSRATRRIEGTGFDWCTTSKIAMSLDGHFVAYGGDGPLRIASFPGLKAVNLPDEIIRSVVVDFAWEGNDKLLLATCAAQQPGAFGKGGLLEYSIPLRKIVRRLLSKDDVSRVSARKDGDMAVVVWSTSESDRQEQNTRRIGFIDISSGKMLAQRPTGDVAVTQFANDAPQVLVGEEVGDCYVYDQITGRISLIARSVTDACWVGMIAHKRPLRSRPKSQ